MSAGIEGLFFFKDENLVGDFHITCEALRKSHAHLVGKIPAFVDTDEDTLRAAVQGPQGRRYPWGGGAGQPWLCGGRRLRGLDRCCCQCQCQCRGFC